MSLQKIAINEIVYREDLYPRFEPDQKIIQKYSDSIEYLPPIKINQNNILIDGFHRWKAHQLAGETEISFEMITTQSEKELKKLAYKLNSIHGLQLSNDEKRRYAQEMFGEDSIKEMSILLGVSEKTIQRWTETQAKAAKEEQERKIVDLYLRAWNTQQSIADILGIGVATVNEIIKKFENRQMSDSEKKFEYFLYNIWNTQKGNETEHFGSFPKIFMDNLLWYHTKSLDIVFDPFAGNGTTVDSCKSMFRRYYCSDLHVKPGREKDILSHDITIGLPENLPKPKMAFIDPPYWKQAEKMYSDNPNDLGNMSLIDFNRTMQNLFLELKQRKVERIAVVIQPTQYKNDFNWTDHIFDFNEMLKDKYRIEMRYILPYSTEQYLPQMVIKAKELNKCLGLNRDLVVWSLL